MKMARSAPEALKILWKDGFLTEEKSQKDVEQELHKKGYNFGDATRKALERAKFLLVMGGKGSKKFIQKYPFVEEGKKSGRKK